MKAGWCWCNWTIRWPAPGWAGEGHQTRQGKFDRAVELQQKNFISGQARDETENALRVADATVSLAEAKLTKLVDQVTVLRHRRAALGKRRRL